jgi:hypothetical protein
VVGWLNYPNLKLITLVASAATLGPWVPTFVEGLIIFLSSKQRYAPQGLKWKALGVALGSVVNCGYGASHTQPFLAPYRPHYFVNSELDWLHYGMCNTWLGILIWEFGVYFELDNLDLKKFYAESHDFFNH